MDRDRRELLKLGLKFLLGVACLLAVVSLLARCFGAELERMGRAFLDVFGYAGIALGTFLADGLHCPVPPQFYMLASIASGWSGVWTIVAVSAGSMLGGVTAYAVARRAANLRFLQRLLDRTRARVDWLFDSYGYWAVAIGSLTPIPFSFLCYVAGGYRMRPRIFILLCLCRIPKIVLYYHLVKLGWASGRA